jgi:hypothetical protein
LYIETMSAEIRDLEDQLYEYDYEYRRLENQNASLQQQLNYLEDQDGGAAQTRRPSILDDLTRDRSNARTPVGPPTRERSSNSLPSPGSNDGFDDTGDFDLDSVSPPTIEMGSEGAPPVSLLESPGNLQTRGGPVSPSVGSPPDFSEAPTFSAPGTATAANDLIASAPADLPDNEMELSLSQVQVPALTASHGIPEKASLTPAVQRVTDKRVIEIAFHPTISRAIDLDGEEGDDGVYIVLQPKNTHGQMVDVPGELQIAILDPSLPKGQDRIGLWTYSADDVKAKMEPIGAQQGIHLRLPWNGQNPRADKVLVFARYTFKDGRRVVGYKEIFLWSDTRGKTVWTPRARSGGNLAEPRTGASMHASNRNSNSNPSNIQFDSVDRGVVRPASGSRSSDPAPEPVRTAGGFLD